MFSSIMLLPLMMFGWGCLAFIILGLITLALAPGLRLTVPNLFLFVMGAFAGAATFLVLYSRIFAKNQLSNAVSIGMVPVLLVGGVLGGSLSVRLKTRFAKTRRD